MLKKIKYNVLGLALLIILGVTGCKQDQVVEDPISPDNYPMVTYTADFEGNTVAEGDTIIYTISLDKALDRSLTFALTYVGGAADDSDFEYSSVTLQPYETEVEFPIIIFEDWEVDPDEAFEFELGIHSLAEKYLVNPATPAKAFSLTIDNYVGGDDLLLSFNWETDIDLGFGVYPTSANVDFDVFISDAAGFDISDPWATFNPTIYAATGSHPEEIVLTEGLFPDGEYVFWFDFWANAFYGYGNETLIPVHTTAAKQGLINVTVEQNPEEVVNANMPGYDPSGIETNGYLCKVKIEGTTYTVYGWDGTEYASGKSVDLRTPRANTNKVYNKLELHK